jgi:hypothetical protein
MRETEVHGEEESMDLRRREKQRYTEKRIAWIYGEGRNRDTWRWRK